MEEMACSTPLAISYSAALTSTSSVVGRHRWIAVGSTGLFSWRNDVRFRNGQVQGAEFGSKVSLFKPRVTSYYRREAIVAKAESAVGVAAAVEDHSTDPNKIFWFDLLEYESTNGPVCLTSFVPKYESSDFEPPAAEETIASDEPAVAEPEAALVVPQPSPEVAPAEITPELVLEEPSAVKAIEDVMTTNPAPAPRAQSPFARYPDLKPPRSPRPGPPAEVSAASSAQTVVVEPSAEVESPDVTIVTAAEDPVAPPTNQESLRAETVPWIPLKPQSPYTRFPDMKPPTSPTPRPPSL